VLFQLTGKRCGDIDGYQVGDTLRVEFAPRGREWKNRQGEIEFFNSLDVLKLDRAEGASGKSGSAAEADESISRSERRPGSMQRSPKRPYPVGLSGDQVALAARGR
jgi:hypothetical protein